MNQNTSDRNVNHSGVGALGLAVAAAIGAALGLAFAPQSGEKTRKELWNKAQDLASGFNETRENVQKFLSDTFGQVTDDLEKAYVEIRGRVIAAVDDISDKTGFTQKKYHEIVDEAVNSIAQGKKWAEKEITAITKRLNDEWEKVQNHHNKKASKKA